jgi:hypothetical protein
MALHDLAFNITKGFMAVFSCKGEALALTLFILENSFVHFVTRVVAEAVVNFYKYF